MPQRHLLRRPHPLKLINSLHVMWYKIWLKDPENMPQFPTERLLPMSAPYPKTEPFGSCGLTEPNLSHQIGSTGCGTKKVKFVLSLILIIPSN